MTHTLPRPVPGLSRNKRRAREGRLALLFVSPSLIALLLVVGYPILAALRMSFEVSSTRIDPATGFKVTSTRFGLANYAVVDGRFLNALWNTTTFTVVSVAIEVVIGVAMALIMSQELRGRGLIRASILVPWAIPTAVSALLWRWIFAPDGVANAVLSADVVWTGNAFSSWVAVVVADTWKTAPFIGLLVLAGLQAIPREVYEAARVDGSKPFTTFWRITVPMVRPVLAVAVLFRILDVLRMFDLPYVLVGPRKDSVETLSMLAYDEMSNLRFGPASAYAAILFVYVVAVAFAFVRLFGADVTRRGAS
ncbi:sugar ABC transporter permease [Sphaerisporangium sp. NPDC051017]|uniref:carbohydrate ABC transporter permease n=1 Tax=Sphaerisporangium sp. NPDC051017 TaxID=3154636 RepID=UPI003439D0ED